MLPNATLEGYLSQNVTYGHVLTIAKAWNGILKSNQDVFLYDGHKLRKY
jgi:hypothetical protein